MCCIFTCCGWMLDLLQRCWIFFMSCCISSAVCCVLITASTSGIALGYNYSLAEYIDLKETNVSVYIKRGVFDDDIADDMEWRRSGGGNKPDVYSDSGLGEEVDLRRSNRRQNEETTMRSGRRLDDSLFEADSQNKYEGSLMKLTAKGFHPSPPYIPTESTKATDPLSVDDLVSEYPPGSLNRLKAIQSVINARVAAKHTPQPDGRRNLGGPSPDRFDQNYKFLNDYPGFSGSRGDSGRRSEPLNEESLQPGFRGNPYRAAVPPPDINAMPVGRIPGYVQLQGVTRYLNEDDDDTRNGVTFPRNPPTVRASPVRPRPTPAKQRIVVADRPVEQQAVTRTGLTRGTPKDSNMFKDDLDKYKQRLLINQYDAPNFKADVFGKKRPGGDDYEEGFKGAPVRRKRSAQSIPKDQDANNVTFTSVINNATTPFSANGNSTIYGIKQTNITTAKPKHKKSIHFKIKKNERRKLLKWNRKNKKRRKARLTSKMTKNKSRIQEEPHHHYHQRDSHKFTSIGQVTVGMSLFISKLSPVTVTKFLSNLHERENQTGTDL